MVKSIIEMTVKKPCTRCGSIEVIAYNEYLRVTPRCKGCGLQGDMCEYVELIEPTMINAYYEYEDKNKKGFFKKILGI